MSESLIEDITKGLAFVLDGEEPIVDGEEWNVESADADGDTIEMELTSEGGCSHIVRMQVEMVDGPKPPPLTKEQRDELSALANEAVTAACRLVRDGRSGCEGDRSRAWQAFTDRLCDLTRL